MPSRKSSPSPEPIESIHVRLKPVLGITPRVYVPALWAAIILAAAFLLLVLPGLKRNGTYLTVRSLPVDAEVFFDGQRLGPTGEVLFAPKGVGPLVVAKSGYEPYEGVRQVRGRVFASRLFPRKDVMAVVLAPRDGYDPWAESVREFAAWTATGTEIDAYAIPPSLTHSARDILAVNAGNAVSDDLALAAVTLPFARDERHIADLLRAETLLAGDGAPVGMDSIAALAVRSAAYLDRHDATASGIARLITPDRLEGLGYGDSPPGSDDIRTDWDASVADYADRASSMPKIIRTVDGIRFIRIDGGRGFVGDLEVVSQGYAPRSGAVPSEYRYEDFYLADTEISNAQFARFVSDVPMWSPENRDALLEAGLANDAYLNDWTGSGPVPGTEDLPVTGVSWFAATAFAGWFSDKNLADTGFQAVLPGENQWEIAARLDGVPESSETLTGVMVSIGNAATGTMGLKGMGGNVREWCRDVFAYYGNRFPEEIIGLGDSSRIHGLERTVRGGAFIDAKLAYPAAVRGGLTPEMSSPVIGFRLALVE